MNHDSISSDDVKLVLLQVPAKLQLQQLHGAKLKGSVVRTSDGSEYNMLAGLPCEEIVNAFPATDGDGGGKMMLGKGFHAGFRLTRAEEIQHPATAWKAREYPVQVVPLRSRSSQVAQNDAAVPAGRRDVGSIGNKADVKAEASLQGAEDPDSGADESNKRKAKYTEGKGKKMRHIEDDRLREENPAGGEDAIRVKSESRTEDGDAKRKARKDRKDAKEMKKKKERKDNKDKRDKRDKRDKKDKKTKENRDSEDEEDRKDRKTKKESKVKHRDKTVGQENKSEQAAEAGTPQNNQIISNEETRGHKVKKEKEKQHKDKKKRL
mmetsp:Transcript_5802/g.17334  ORF Transcript_5802/g.17334 Transcript_5802/m.17334 type:complete len:322 (-) Transcript_5802:2646-3611(-)